MLGFCWNCLKLDYLTSLGGFNRFLIHWIFFNPFGTVKIKKLNS